MRNPENTTSLVHRMTLQTWSGSGSWYALGFTSCQTRRQRLLLPRNLAQHPTGTIL